MKKMDGIYIERVPGTKEKMQIKKQQIEGKYLLHILQVVSEDRRRRVKENEKLAKVIRRYGDRNTEVVGNEMAIRELGLQNHLFLERKKKLMVQAGEILRLNEEWEKGERRRRHFLLVAESEAWSYGEIQELLLVAKNYYEDLYIQTKIKAFPVEQLQEWFYEEYGIVLCFLKERRAREEKVDFGLYLLEWDEGQWKQYYPKSRYVVAEWTEK